MEAKILTKKREGLDDAPDGIEESSVPYELRRQKDAKEDAIQI